MGYIRVSLDLAIELSCYRRLDQDLEMRSWGQNGHTSTVTYESSGNYERAGRFWDEKIMEGTSVIGYIPYSSFTSCSHTHLPPD